MTGVLCCLFGLDFILGPVSAGSLRLLWTVALICKLDSTWNHLGVLKTTAAWDLQEKTQHGVLVLCGSGTPGGQRCLLARGCGTLESCHLSSEGRQWE